ncbi:MAG: hypothetical protein E6J05_02250 [Chloroflexi bacterium]|nr:MAG: hypothetical protein E6J05_02250 [Chloroflexota bacterium]
MKTGAVLFAGCKPEVAAGPDGRIIAVGGRARAAAGRSADVVRLRGTAGPGLIDAHIHLEGLADRHLTLELTGQPSLEKALELVSQWSLRLPKDAWVVGSGWYNDAWPNPAFPTRKHLDVAAGGRPAYMHRKDGHSAWVSSAALKKAAVDRNREDPPGGVIDRDARGEPTGVRSGWGDDWLRIWGVKAFLDGSLGSRTAEMLDGSGTARLGNDDLNDMIVRCARAQLNVCLHAIGDGAVRRALDALEPHRSAWRLWRPRIEHAQCVDPEDMKRFGRIGVIASMQPIHAVADRGLADQYWPKVTPNAYAWGALERAGARLVFGSDAPVETADPLLGIDAASNWRRRAKWHPELSISRASAMRAYTSSAAFAVGMEADVGALNKGMLCDMTVVDGDSVVATVVGGRVSWRRKPPAASRL